MNPSVPQSVIDEAMERDPLSAAAEYGAQFRSDIESYITRELWKRALVWACANGYRFTTQPIAPSLILLAGLPIRA